MFTAMHTVSVAEMRELEDRAFRAGVDPGDLMDRAATGLAHRILEHFPSPGHAIGYLGKGHNAGDVLAALPILQRHGWIVEWRAAYPEIDCRALTRQRLRRLAALDQPARHPSSGPRILLDGLLGIGAAGPLRGPLTELARDMLHLRTDHGAAVIAVDVPSGLDADTGEAAAGCVVADLTLTIGAPKCGLLADAAVDHVGRLGIVPLEELTPPANDRAYVISPESLPGLLPPRPHRSHKGDAGRVAILAGAPGTEGAAELAAHGALKGGGGLVALFLDPSGRGRPRSEIMVQRSARRIEHAFAARADALVIGPGLGPLNEPHRQQLLEQLAADSRPMVLDADALRHLSTAGRLDLLRPHHLLTPHPGEFAQLAPDLAALPRLEAARAFADRHPATLLLKGARTIIARRGEPLRVNPTGHAGMATGGQGDVLAGVLGALLAGGMDPAAAASLGTWLCGRAAERALTHGGESEASLTATDTLEHLGGAFHDWRLRRR